VEIFKLEELARLLQTTAAEMAAAFLLVPIGPDPRASWAPEWGDPDVAGA
jgi:hypothetical protein